MSNRHCPGCSHPSICRTNGCAADEHRANAVAAISPTAAQIITDLLALIEHAASNGWDYHPSSDQRVITAQAHLARIPTTSASES